MEDVITDIIRDLGLAAVPGNHPWMRRTPAEIAELCARAAQPVPPIAVLPVQVQTPPPRPIQAQARPGAWNSS